MAQTKVSLIKDGVIVVGHLHQQHGITTDNIGEGINNVYFTTDRVQDYLDAGGYVPGSETLTSISLASNVLSYVDENGNTTNLDLSLYLDDTNLARITSGTLNSGTGVATFTRDDATTFTVDFSAFLSDADDYVSSASFNTADGVLTLTRLSGNTVTVDLDNRYLTSLGWNSNDNFSGTYPLVWKAGEVPYTASWLNVNGSTDTLHTRNISATGDITNDGDSRGIYWTGGTTSGQNRIVIGEQNTYGVGFRWDSGSSLQFDGFWSTSVTGAANKALGSVNVNTKTWSLLDNLTTGTLTVSNGVINMNNNDGFVYDDGANVMKVKYDGNTYNIWTQANDGSGSGLDADLLDGNHGSYFDHRRYTDSTNYLGGYYVSGGTEKPNSSVFGAGKLKIAMLRGGSPNLGFGGTWNDVLWMSTYTGGDVKRSTALVSSKYDNTSVWVAKQNYDSSSWGTGYLMWNSGNLDYEEGTWSMVWGYGVSGSATTAAASSFGGMSQTCKYVKIGRLVHCSFYFKCTSFPWGSGSTGSPAWIAEAGLPYAMESDAQGTGSFRCFPGFNSSRTTANEVTGVLMPWKYGTNGAGLAPVGNREYYSNLGAIDTDAFATGPGGDFNIRGAFTYYTSS